MNEDLIIKIMLEFCYDQTIKTWSKTRLLSKEFKKMIDNQKYNKDSWGRRTFISTNTCNICDKKSDPKNYNMLMYVADDINYGRRIITHCKHWLCHLSAIYSMINHYENDNIFLIKNFQKNNNIIIPRSDGTETNGFCKTNFVVKKENKYYISTYWYDNNNLKFEKLVPFEYYSKKHPEIISINLLFYNI